MRCVQKEIKFGFGRNKLYYEQFSNYDEYWRIVESREKTNAHDRDHDLNHICDDSSWVGCKSYDEAKNLLTKGWDAKVEYIKNMVQKEIDTLGTKSVVKQFNDVVGFMPIVPMAVMNLPVCMINTRQTTKKQRVVKFLIAMNRGCKYGSKEIIEKMTKILARISVLEKNGYRCRIELFGSFHDGDNSGKTIACHSVLIKSENQLFDIKRMAFPIAHSAMQRVFGFGWESSLPIDYRSYHCCGLGKSVQYWSEERRNDLLNAIVENNEQMIFIGMESDIDEVFGKEVK